MELDAIRAAKLLHPSMEVVLLIRSGGFLDRMRDSLLADHAIAVEAVRFRTNYSFPLILATRRVLRAYKVTHVICFGNSELKSLFLAFAGLGLTIILRHGTTKQRPKRDIFHRLVYRYVRWHVVVSRHLARNVTTIFPVAPESIRLIYPSLPPLPAARFRSPSKPLQIIHVGRVCPGKGQDAAVRACAHVARAGIDFSLTFVGNAADDEAASLRSLAEKCRIGDRVRLTGHVENVYTELSSADVFLFPSLAEGFGNALVEALSCGLVVIVYDNTGLSEIMRRGFYGHLVPDRDERALADVLARVCRNIAVEKKLAYANVDLARRLFSREQEQLEYLKLLGVHPPTAPHTNQSAPGNGKKGTPRRHDPSSEVRGVGDCQRTVDNHTLSPME